jgi:hypothetical protein
MNLKKRVSLVLTLVESKLETLTFWKSSRGPFFFFGGFTLQILLWFILLSFILLFLKKKNQKYKLNWWQNAIIPFPNSQRLPIDDNKQ